MVNELSALEKAKECATCEESAEEYCTSLFVLLRAQKVPFRRAVHLVCAEMRNLANGQINYNFLYDASPTMGNEETAQLLQKVRVLNRPILEKAIKKSGRNPTSRIGHFVWTEMALTEVVDGHNPHPITMREALSKSVALFRELVDTSKE